MAAPARFDALLHVAITPVMATELERAALDDERTVSSYVRKALRSQLQHDGFLRDDRACNGKAETVGVAA